MFAVGYIFHNTAAMEKKVRKTRKSTKTKKYFVKKKKEKTAKGKIAASKPKKIKDDGKIEGVVYYNKRKDKFF